MTSRSRRTAPTGQPSPHEADSGGTTDCAAHGVQKCGQPHSYTFPKVKARYALLSVNSWVSAKTGTPANGYGWGLKEFGVFATS